MTAMKAIMDGHVVTSLPQKALTVSAQNTVNVPVTEIQTPTVNVPVTEIPVIEQPIAVVVPSFTSISPVGLLTANPYQNRLFFGGQRTGKSFLAAIATRYLASKGIKVFHLNLSYTLTSEGRDEDAEYWEHATESIRFDLDGLDEEEALKVIDSAVGMVESFWSTTGAILVVDEAPAQASRVNGYAHLLERLNKKIASCSAQSNSTGVKRGKSVWAIGPEFVAGNMTQEGKSFCKTGSLVHVFIHPQGQSEWNGQRLVFDTGLFQQLTANFQTAILDPNLAPSCTRGTQVDGTFTISDGSELPSWSGEKCVANRQVTTTKPMDPIAHLENAYQAPAVEVELKTVVDSRPEGLDEFPMVAILWDYLLGKEPRSSKLVSNAIRKSERISMEDLKAKLPATETFNEGIKKVLDYGVIKGFLLEVSEDSFTAIEKH